MAREIFVFGSTRAGRHGKGAALEAHRNHGAIRGRGEGLQGRSYAIPTKDASIKTLPLAAIQEHVLRFRAFVWSHPQMTFRLTPIGCGLAGYRPEEIAPMFQDVPGNVVLPPEFAELLK